MEIELIMQQIPLRAIDHEDLCPDPMENRMEGELKWRSCHKDRGIMSPPETGVSLGTAWSMLEHPEHLVYNHTHHSRSTTGGQRSHVGHLLHQGCSGPVSQSKVCRDALVWKLLTDSKIQTEIEQST